MLPLRMFGGIFSEHWIDGRRCGPLRRRHSGKGRAVPERCPSISVSSFQLARRHDLDGSRGVMPAVSYHAGRSVFASEHRLLPRAVASACKLSRCAKTRPLSRSVLGQLRFRAGGDSPCVVIAVADTATHSRQRNYSGNKRTACRRSEDYRQRCKQLTRHFNRGVRQTAKSAE
jgi:hypothetical protein